MKTLAVVPARKGSQGIPGKNKRVFMGKPLVSWAIEVGQRTCERVVVTSDDQDILALAREYRVDTIIRPLDLARDDTPMIDVLRHVLALAKRALDVIVLLQPTQPLRTDKHVKCALSLLEKRPDVDSVVSLVPIPAHMSPDFAIKVEAGLMRFFLPGNVTRRQDCRPAYYRDGSVYAMRVGILKEAKLYGRCAPLIIERGMTCNLDDEEDWKEAERMWRNQHGI